MNSLARLAREKEAFLGEARALLFPIDWPEPFGLVMIEAMPMEPLSLHSSAGPRRKFWTMACQGLSSITSRKH